MKKTKIQIMSDSELEEMVDNILEFNNLNQTEKNEYFFLIESKALMYSKRELYHQFIKNMISWFYHLRKCIDLEKYELCAKIRDVIQVEKSEFYSTLQFCFEGFYEKDIKEIKKIENELKKQFEI